MQAVKKTLQFRSDGLLRAAWAAVVLVLLLFCIDSLLQPPGRDSSAFTYVAQGILDGEVPYVDRWDHKGPLIYVLNVIGLVISDVWGIRLLEIVFLLCTVSVACLIVRQFGTEGRVFPIAIFLGYFGVFVGRGNATEEYALLFQFLALYIFTVNERKVHGILAPLMLGILGAAAFLLRPNLIGVWIAIGAYWLLVHRGQSGKTLLWAVLGGSMPILTVLGSFAALGGLSTFLDAAFHYNLEYSSISLVDRLSAMWRAGGTKLVFLLIPLVFSWCIGLYHLTSTEQDGHENADRLLGLSLILLPVELVLVSLSGYDFGNYYLTLLPVVTVLMAFAASRMTGLVSLPSSLLSSVLLLCVSMYFLPIGIKDFSENTANYAREGALSSTRHFRVAERIVMETASGDSILVWGHEPQLYLLSERTAPTRFFYQHPLLLNGYSSPNLLEEFLSDITIGSPEIIVDAHNEKLPSLSAADRANGRFSFDKYSYSTEDFGSLFSLVGEEYQLLEEIEGYTVYKRIDRSSH